MTLMTASAWAATGAEVLKMLNRDSDQTLEIAEVIDAATKLFAQINPDNDLTLERKETQGRLTDADWKAVNNDNDNTLEMDEWLTNLSAGSNVQPPTLAQIARAKPADLKDACFTDNGAVKIEELQVYRGDTACNRLYPAFAMPRLVAGEPLANNVLKCQLKAPDPHDYKVRFTASQLAELKETFPTGVCNYAVPGVGQVPTQGTWQIFSSPPH